MNELMQQTGNILARVWEMQDIKGFPQLRPHCVRNSAVSQTN